ncbi:YbhN family protein [Streptosporangium amethystogenes subsp. fukuiense]|uniref:lysylphosphatidylglycerol synthase transmembrane domain-containing protein n=1 Tax=Streptosporangium amethystogenes TaxID=2002 RepID=UPI0036213DD5
MRLERFRPRTLITIIGTAFAAYFLVYYLTQINLNMITSAKWSWTGVALVAAMMSYVAAALMLMGFVPEKLPLGRTVLVQFAGSFVKLVAPAAVSGVAINTRYLQKRGIPLGQAVASVGASQLIGLAFHIALLLLFAYITGSNTASSFTPSRTLVLTLLAVAVVVLIIVSVPRLRRMITARLRSLFSGVIPRLLDVLQSPRKIIEGFSGTLMLTLFFVLCLDACVRAFGGSLNFAAVAIVFLAGNAIGSAAPTPGGLGAVELSLSVGLTLSGLPGEVATSAVLLFRLLTFWLPVLPGWASFAHLQRQEAL